MPRGCAGGGCGVCKVVVKRGEIHVFKPMSKAHVTEEEVAQKVVLACCVNPRSDLEISLANAGRYDENEVTADFYDDRSDKR
jgi:ferredoxin